MNELQIAFGAYVIGVACGGFAAYFVRPWDFNGPEDTQPTTANEHFQSQPYTDHQRTHFELGTSMTNETLHLAFYKGKGNWLDKLIKWWTKSEYSHCELVLSGGIGKASDCVSSSPRDGGVRRKLITLDADSWDILPVSGSRDSVLFWLDLTAGRKYDVLGALGFVWSPLVNSEERWFCSEWCAEALGWAEPWRYTPAAVASITRSFARSL